MTLRRSLVGLAVVTLAVAALPLVTQSTLYRSLFVSAALFAIMGAGMNITVGLTGQFAFLQHAMVGVGAYTVAILVQRYDVPYPAAFVLALLLASLLTAVIAVAAGRLTGVYLGLATFGYSALIATAIDRWRGMTGGPNGISLRFVPSFGWHLERDLDYFYAALIVLTIVVAVHIVLTHIPWGRRTIAMRENEALASSLGVRALPRKVVAMMVGSAAGAAAGAIYAPYLRYIDPTLFVFTLLVNILVVVIVGGRGLWFGPYIGAAVLVGLPQASGFATEYRDLVVGAVTVLIILVAPVGLGGLLLQLPKLFRRSAPVPLSDDEVTRMPAIAATEPAAALVLVAPETVASDGAIAGAPLIELRDVSKSFGAVHAVSDMSLRIGPGEFVGLIGPNGAGKTTLFDVVVGRQPPNSGLVLYEGENVTGRPSYQLARRGLRRSFQSPIIFPELTIEEALAVASTSTESDGLAVELLDSFGLARYLGDRGNEMPAGIAKLVGVTIAAASRPNLLLLDEPAAGLNPREREILIAIMRRLNGMGVTVWLVEHDIDLVLSVVERLVVMDQGRLVADGAPEVVVADERVITAYLGVPA